MTDQPTIVLNHFFFREQTTLHGGFLTMDKACHACWYFLVLATQAKQFVGKGPESQTIIVPAHRENDVLWNDLHLEQIARSVATLYGLPDPGHFWPFWPQVEQEAARQGIPVDPMIRNLGPGKDIIH